MLEIFPKGCDKNNFDKTYIITGDTNDGFVFVRDHMPVVENLSMDYDHNNIFIPQCHNTIKDIIKLTNYKTNYVFGESYLKWDEFSEFYTTPCFFSSLAITYQHIDIEKHMYSDDVTVMALMRQNRPHRHLLSAWLNSNPCNLKYTQNFDNDDLLLSELVRCTKYEHLKSTLPKYTVGSNEDLTSVRSRPWDPISAFEMFESLITSSTFHIITEPNFFELGCSITEKYLWCLYGHSFPIFCGSYKLPDAIKEIGFDVFDDIIDHSYQYELNPTLRTLNALENNKHLLNNKNIRKIDYIERHQSNLKLVRQDLDKTLDKLYKPIEKLSKKIDLSPVLKINTFKPFTQKVSYRQHKNFPLIPSNNFN